MILPSGAAANEFPATREDNPRLVVGVTVGASAYSLLRGQLAWFREQGWLVTLVASPDVKAHRAGKREQVGFVGIPMKRGIAPIRDACALIHWIRMLRQLQPAAINVGTPKAALLGTLAAWFSRVPRRLYTVRGLRLEGASGPVAWLLWLMEWITMRLATDILFVSASLAKEARDRRLPLAGKSRLIGQGSSNGVDAAAVAQRVSQVDRKALRADLGFVSDDFVVGFVGRINQDKGVGTLLEAFEDSNLDGTAKALLVGSFESPELRRAVEALGEKLRHIDWTDDVWGYLAAMDVLCLPTRREGFPNVVLEAGAAGLPVIATCATGSIDSVIDGQTGFLIPVDDANALADRISRLARDRNLSKNLGSAGRDRVNTEFRQEQIWQGIQEILEGTNVQ